MFGESMVDNFIGLSKATWQPVRTLKAEEKFVDMGKSFWKVCWRVSSIGRESCCQFTVLKAVDVRREISF